MSKKGTEIVAYYSTLKHVECYAILVHVDNNAITLAQDVCTWMEHGIDHENPVHLSQIPHVTACGEESQHSNSSDLGTNVGFFSD